MIDNDNASEPEVMDVESDDEVIDESEDEVADAEHEGVDDEKEDDDDDDDDDDDECAQRRELLGACYDRYCYAIRSQNKKGSAARAFLGGAWYAVFSVESILHRAPLEVPFFETEAEASAWARDSEAKRAVRHKSGFFIYNHLMGIH